MSSRCRSLFIASSAFTGAIFAPLPTAGAEVPAPQTLVQISPREQPEGAIPLPVPMSPSHGSPDEQWILLRGEPVLINVSHPTLTPVLPDPDRATGAAMIVAPGGGFLLLAMDKEGWNVARWLADHGIAAFVLKYRIRPFYEGLSERRKLAGTADSAMVVGYRPALEDAQAALRLVHSRARSWMIDPTRIGMIGFSAGARLTLTMATEPSDAIRPAFAAAIYPPMDSLQVPVDAAPLFTAIAADDTTMPIGDLGLIRSWHAANRPVEFHLYEKGGHGFGVPGAPGTSTIAMMDELYAWMSGRGLLDASSSGH